MLQKSSIEQRRASLQNRTRKRNGWHLYAAPVIVAILLWALLNRHLLMQFSDRKEKPLEHIELVSNDPEDMQALEDAELETGKFDVQAYRRLSLNVEEEPYAAQIAEIEAQIDRDELNEATRGLIALARVLPTSPRCLLASAHTLDRRAEQERSQKALKQSIAIYKKVVELQKADERLVVTAGRRLIDRLNFAGKSNEAVKYAEMLANRWPQNLQLANELGVAYMMANRNEAAKHVFRATLTRAPNNPFALCHYAFVLKQNEGRVAESIGYFERCLRSGQTGVMDARFFYHLGDALMRTNRSDEVRHKNI